MVTGGDGLSLATPTTRAETLGILDVDAVVDFASRMPGGIVRADAEPRLVSIRP